MCGQIWMANPAGITLTFLKDAVPDACQKQAMNSRNTHPRIASSLNDLM
jgi:hypothetical protein